MAQNRTRPNFPNTSQDARKGPVKGVQWHGKHGGGRDMPKGGRMHGWYAVMAGPQHGLVCERDTGGARGMTHRQGL